MTVSPLAVATNIEGLVHRVRDHRVMLDADLARLYGVATKVLNQAVRRNASRFPEDFMFRLTVEEMLSLRSQIVTLKTGRGEHSKYLPLAFTEQGIAMLSSVLKSGRAIAVNIAIMRTFVRIRGLQGLHRDVKQKLDELERRVGAHDRHIRAIFEALNRLVESPPPPRKRIGF